MNKKTEKEYQNEIRALNSFILEMKDHANAHASQSEKYKKMLDWLLGMLSKETGFSEDALTHMIPSELNAEDIEWAKGKIKEHQASVNIEGFNKDEADPKLVKEVEDLLAELKMEYGGPKGRKPGWTRFRISFAPNATVQGVFEGLKAYLLDVKEQRRDDVS